MTELGGHLYLLGRCGAVLQWDPVAGSSSLILPDKLTDDAFSFAVGPARLAILDNERRRVRVYDRQGKPLQELQYSGETSFTSLALVGDTVLASSYYDDHLVWLYAQSAGRPTRLVSNPRYWPDRGPRYSSYVQISSGENTAYAFDLLDFNLYVIDPLHRSVVATYPKEPHPLWRPVTKPPADAPAKHGRYTGSIIAISAHVADDHAYVLMVDRTFGSQEKGDGYLEIAASKLSERKWRTLARLTDRTRYAGSFDLSVIHNTAYLLKPGGTVLAVPLAGN
ncbi:MAG: hypothetical protein MUF10_13915 [Thermoanaerobaculaceae bacterium]|jgi:hypothetical protein|nr:hypothetical protein [Thermoanaerobaculaceae bacterium]